MSIFQPLTSLNIIKKQQINKIIPTDIKSVIIPNLNILDVTKNLLEQ